MLIQWTHIMIHHSKTKDSGTVSWSAIRRYHRDDLHWRDIGYHFGIEQVGGEYEVFVGRPLTEAGAHCKQSSMNTKAIGICVVGDFDKVPPDPEMLGVLIHRLLKPLMEQFHISRDRIVFHREYASKTCPGKVFYKEVLFNYLES